MQANSYRMRTRCQRLCGSLDVERVGAAQDRIPRSNRRQRAHRSTPKFSFEFRYHWTCRPSAPEHAGSQAGLRGPLGSYQKRLGWLRASRLCDIFAAAGLKAVRDCAEAIAGEGKLVSMFITAVSSLRRDVQWVTGMCSIGLMNRCSRLAPTLLPT
jgi:hypothetical protein